ncbi:MAG TPA: recombinase family protein [Paludibacteraceae bacterium]|nr:recombinase family protein [Paludibacteraceae bacterium]
MKRAESKDLAVAYIRVSTEEQSKEGVSLEAQEEKIKAYCNLRGLEIVEICIDAGVSGSKRLESREAGSKLMKLINEGKANAVVAFKLDRLFRDAEDALHTTKSWDEKGIALHLVDMGGQTIDTTTAMGRFFLNMMAGFAELERNLISERTATALNYKKSNKQVYAPIPFGYVRVGDRLIEDQEEQIILNKIFNYRKEGLSYWKIADELNTIGVETKKGGNKWYASTVKYILDNNLYDEAVMV